MSSASGWLVDQDCSLVPRGDDCLTQLTHGSLILGQGHTPGEALCHPSTWRLDLHQDEDSLIQCLPSPDVSFLLLPVRCSIVSRAPENQQPRLVSVWQWVPLPSMSDTQQGPFAPVWTPLRPGEPTGRDPISTSLGPGADLGLGSLTRLWCVQFDLNWLEEPPSLAGAENEDGEDDGDGGTQKWQRISARGELITVPSSLLASLLFASGVILRPLEHFTVADRASSPIRPFTMPMPSHTKNAKSERRFSSK
ncbi:hypothetical protein B0T10DRAFT_465492 [Thelonectria olida]|uniref:Uncharacterized protein n=1 Tax=Thelonectria olida TaxID=1576542 RepID=A0A9P8VVM6_9HYPO|nr:hypothetical protein B0T10DRAFT_465492 [Thelonectria olida]